jgi:endonuclease/exonuclease/phosphatase family metal-dependent hydrolase
MTDWKVMSFNVRQMDGEDGAQSWEHRKDVLIETIRLHQPDLLATQETWDEQAGYILAHFPHYRAFGRGRFGDARDKHNKVFYDGERMELLDTGEIWISRSPHIPGSKDWDIPSPRMITWGLLRLDGKVDLMLMNTHFPYGRGADEERRETVRLILEKIAELPPALPVVLTGDFNAAAGGEIYQSLRSVLEDAWEFAETRRGPEGTLHGFGRITASRRIDWILFRHACRVLSAETVTYTAGGLYPSDHYPVCARLELAPARSDRP